jgi:hypothetical protein
MYVATRHRRLNRLGIAAVKLPPNILIKYSGRRGRVGTVDRLSVVGAQRPVQIHGLATAYPPYVMKQDEVMAKARKFSVIAQS